MFFTFQFRSKFVLLLVYFYFIFVLRHLHCASRLLFFFFSISFQSHFLYVLAVSPSQFFLRFWKSFDILASLVTICIEEKNETFFSDLFFVESDFLSLVHSSSSKLSRVNIYLRSKSLLNYSEHTQFTTKHKRTKYQNRNNLTELKGKNEFFCRHASYQKQTRPLLCNSAYFEIKICLYYFFKSRF